MFNLRQLISRLTGSAAAPANTTLDPAELSADWLVVGLGNPGPRYAATRHNVGYMALDDLLAEDGHLLTAVKGIKAEAAEVTWDGQRVLLLRSSTFMNLSGEAIAPLAEVLGIPADQVVVIHDELDLPTGKVRVKLGGNENGHNGLKSTTDRLGTRDYLRVRIGISRPPRGMPVPEYVLSPMDADADFDASVATAAEAARLLVTQGLQPAQNKIHSR